MRVKVCITTPHTLTYSMYNSSLHIYAGQGLYKYTTYTYIQLYNSYLHLYAGQGIYKYTTYIYICTCTIHTSTYMQAKVWISTPKYSMYISYLHLYAGQGFNKYTTYTYVLHTVCTIHITYTYMRIKVCINTPNAPTVCYTYTCKRVCVGINIHHIHLWHVQYIVQSTYIHTYIWYA